MLTENSVKMWLDKNVPGWNNFSSITPGSLQYLIISSLLTEIITLQQRVDILERRFGNIAP